MFMYAARNSVRGNLLRTSAGHHARHALKIPAVRRNPREASTPATGAAERLCAFYDPLALAGALGTIIVRP
jgi:hypothetical protein